MKKSLCLISAFAVLLVASYASAGGRATSPVVIDSVNRTAYGNLGDARNSSDSTQYIGCMSWSAPGFLSGSCFAVNTAGTYVSCYTTDAKIVSVIQSLSPDGFLSFNWNASGNCATLYTINTSWTSPKVP